MTLDRRVLSGCGQYISDQEPFPNVWSSEMELTKRRLTVLQYIIY